MLKSKSIFLENPNLDLLSFTFISLTFTSHQSMQIDRVSVRLFGFIRTSTGPHALPVSSRTTKIRPFASSHFTSRPIPPFSASPSAVPEELVTVARSRPAYSHRPIVPIANFRSLSTATTAKMGSLPEASHAVRVLIAGGCYAGLATAVNLLDLAGGLTPRQSEKEYPHHPDLPRFDVDITIVDERDGYCKSSFGIVCAFY